MGHLGHLKEEYRALVKRLEGTQVALPEPEDPGARAAWREILEILYTPEEAAIASRLPVRPSDLQTIAARLDMFPEELRPRLDAMADKGLVMDLVHPKTGKTRYLLSPPVVGFFEFSMMRVGDSLPRKRLAEALRAYTEGDDTFAREAFGGETVVGRALVHEGALGPDPLPDVLDWERATAVVEDARPLAVSYCYCRHKAEHLGERCDTPMENCLSLNTGADFVIRRGFGRAVERSEALEILGAAREAHLVRIADNVRSRVSYVCSCCGCCCNQLQAINRFDLAAVRPSGFLARSDQSKCKGCSLCSRTCPIGAIRMVPLRVAARRKNALVPEVDSERCIGCGVCATTCRRDAMHMERRPERPYVPVNAIERSVRMSVERGRLAQLLFDEGASRGTRFLSAVLQAIGSLPPVEKAMALGQVRSRFVRYALGSVTGR